MSPQRVLIMPGVSALLLSLLLRMLTLSTLGFLCKKTFFRIIAKPLAPCKMQERAQSRQFLSSPEFNTPPQKSTGPSFKSKNLAQQEDLC